MTLAPQFTDTLVALLLGSSLGLPREAADRVKPLTALNWSTLVAKIAESGWNLSDLLGAGVTEIQRALSLKQETAERMAVLLERGGQLALELERLASRGIWAVTRADDAYPAKLRKRLSDHAPVVLFGAGSPDALQSTGVAVVGSRDLDQGAEEFASTFGARCGEEGLTVFSGAARGTDRIAMLAAIESSGTALGVVADSLDRMIRDQDFGRAIRCERLTLITPFHPSARFDVGNAMARNKVIYSLSDVAVIVTSAIESGGTWAGAVENLKKGWVPLFVRNEQDAPPGNHELLKRGGNPLSMAALPPKHQLLPALLNRARHSSEGFIDHATRPQQSQHAQGRLI